MADKIKSIQLNYAAPEGPHATVRETDTGSAVEMGASKETFVLASESQGISLSPGKGNKVNVQAMPQDVIYGGMLAQQNGLYGLLPSTAVTPVPAYNLSPPLENMMSSLRDIMIISSSFL